MTKLLAPLAALLLLVGCSSGAGGSADSKTLTVAATAVPHAEILKQVKPILAKEGIELGRPLQRNDLLRAELLILAGLEVFGQGQIAKTDA